MAVAPELGVATPCGVTCFTNGVAREIHNILFHFIHFIFKLLDGLDGFPKTLTWFPNKVYILFKFTHTPTRCKFDHTDSKDKTD